MDSKIYIHCQAGNRKNRWRTIKKRRTLDSELETNHSGAPCYDLNFAPEGVYLG